MTNKNELNIEELEKVSGGIYELSEEGKQYKSLTTTEIGKYDTENYIGRNLFLEVKHYHKVGSHSYEVNYWLYGTITRSFEKTTRCGSERTAELVVIASGGKQTHSGTIEVNLDECKIYV